MPSTSTRYFASSAKYKYFIWPQSSWLVNTCLGDGLLLTSKKPLQDPLTWICGHRCPVSPLPLSSGSPTITPPGHPGQSDLPAMTTWLLMTIIVKAQCETIQGWSNMKMPSYQRRKSCCGDKMISQQSHVLNRISYKCIGRITSLYWIGPGC